MAEVLIMKDLIIRRAEPGKTGLKAFKSEEDLNRVTIKKYSDSGNLRGVGARVGKVNLKSGAQLTSVNLTDKEIIKIQNNFN